MSKRLLKTSNNNGIITCIDPQLEQISNWLLKFQPINDEFYIIEIYYIKELINQYKTGKMHQNSIIKKINKLKAEYHKINVNIVIEVVEKLSEFLDKNSDNILHKIKKILYEACLNEALKILNFSNDVVDDLNILFFKAFSLGISTELLTKDIDQYLIDNINQGLNESIFYEFVTQINEILSVSENNQEVNNFAEIECFDHNIKMIMSVIGE